MLDALDAAAVRDWSRAAVDRLVAHRTEINALNVFPVADGDTGSNLLTTLRAADDAVRTALSDAATSDQLSDQPSDQLSDQLDAPAVLDALAAGAARGAVGNSGFIVSQILRGIAEAATDAGRCDGPSLAAGLRAGSVLARAAVVAPVEGTVLTVARAAADAARGATLAEVVTAALAGADLALRRTTAQLADLAEHGVVDAGGRGLVVLLDSLVRVVTGAAGELTPVSAPTPGRGAVREAGSGEFGYEVQYLLDATAEAVDDLRRELTAIGDSVAVVAVAAGVWKVHVHVNDVGGAIETALVAGRPHGITVVRFADDASDPVDAVRSVDPVGSGDPDPRDGSGATAVVAVAPGQGLAHLFEAEGVHAVEGSGGAPPSTEDVLAAIRGTRAREVVLLPNASRVTGVAEAAAAQARRAGSRVAVVPTRSPVQGLAAIAVHDATRPFDDDVVAMAEAAAATRFAELTVAAGEALTAVGVCQAGDVLGLIDGEVVEIGRGMLAVAFGLVDRLLGVGAELMTVVIGADAPRRAGELIEAHIRGRAPLTDVTVYVGGQPEHPVVIGAE